MQAYIHLFLLCAISFAVNAANACSRPIIFGARELGFATIIDQNGEVSGAVPDFLRRVASRTGCEIRYQVTPSVRAHYMFESGQVDLIYASQTPVRDQVGKYLPAIHYTLSLITLKNNPKTGGKPLAALYEGKLQINVVRGFDYGTPYQVALARLKGQNRFEDVIDTDVLAKKIQTERADGTIISPPSFAVSAQKFELENQLILTPLPNMPVSTGFYLSNSSLSESDSKLLKSAIEAELKAGSYWNLYASRVPKWALQGFESEWTNK